VAARAFSRASRGTKNKRLAAEKRKLLSLTPSSLLRRKERESEHATMHQATVRTGAL
jgi:hypothetical protein